MLGGAMRLLQRPAIALSLLMFGLAPSFAANEMASGCVPLTIHTRPADIVAACNAALAAPELTNEKRAEFLLARGRGYKAMRQLHAAIADFEAGIDLAPGNIELRIFRGWAAFDQRDFEALPLLVTYLLERHPDNAAVLDFAGAVAVVRGDARAAREAFDRALAIDPDLVMARDHRASLHWRANAYEAALADYELLANTSNPDADSKYSERRGRKIALRTLARLNRALIFEEMGDNERAEQAFADFAQVEPGAVAYGWWADFHQGRSQFARAQADLEKALSYEPDFWFLHNLAGINFFYLKDYERSVQFLARAIELNPDSGSSYWRRAMSLRELQRIDEAVADAQRAAQVDPEYFQRTVARRLTKAGYLPAGVNTRNAGTVVSDAVQACMLDERCW